MPNMPDITKAQIAAVVSAVVAIAAGFGFDVSPATQQAIIQGAAALAGLWIIGDGIVRHGRSRMLANIDPAERQAMLDAAQDAPAARPRR